jgi:hypothetical protein
MIVITLSSSKLSYYCAKSLFMRQKKFIIVLLNLLVVACLSESVRPVMLFAKSDLKDQTIYQQYLKTSIAQSLTQAGQKIVAGLVYANNNLLIASYIPEISALSDWDDETRIILYQYQQKQHTFKRIQFVTRSGQSLRGRLNNWKVQDLNGDGAPELILRGQTASIPVRQTFMLLTYPHGGAFKNRWVPLLLKESKSIELVIKPKLTLITRDRGQTQKFDLIIKDDRLL